MVCGHPSLVWSTRRCLVPIAEVSVASRRTISLGVLPFGVSSGKTGSATVCYGQTNGRSYHAPTVQYLRHMVCLMLIASLLLSRFCTEILNLTTGATIPRSSIFTTRCLICSLHLCYSHAPAQESLHLTCGATKFHSRQYPYCFTFSET